MGKYTIIDGSSLPISQWSGGTTRQLAIYPATADYAARNFVWRVSTATIETPESLFTPLPGVGRTIMVLDGRMTLTHEGRCSRELGPFEQESFRGEWTTRSRGRVRDFNVMVKGGESRCEVIEAAAGEVIDIAAGKDFEPFGERLLSETGVSCNGLSDNGFSGRNISGSRLYGNPPPGKGFPAASLVLYFLSPAVISFPGEEPSEPSENRTVAAGDLLVATTDADDETGAGRGAVSVSACNPSCTLRLIAVRIAHDR